MNAHNYDPVIVFGDEQGSVCVWPSCSVLRSLRAEALSLEADLAATITPI